MCGVICRFKKLFIARAGKHFVISGGPIKQPLGIYLAVEIGEGSRKISFDKFVVRSILP